ncbi:hypothetical protein JCM6882_006137 [Rhodosporidiobolus microsporus]
MSSRPRRSTAAASFTHLLTPIHLSSSSSSSSSSDEGEPQTGTDGAPGPSGTNGTTAGVKNKKDKPKKPRRRAMYIPSESSGSEFDAGAHSSPDEAADDPSSSEGDAAVDDADDLKYDSEGDGAADSDVSGTVVGGSGPSEQSDGEGSGSGGGRTRRMMRGGGGGAIRMPGRRGRGVGVGRLGGGRGKASQHAQPVFSAAAAPSRTASGLPLPPRARPPKGWPLSGWDAQYLGAGPLGTWGVPFAVFEREGKEKEGKEKKGETGRGIEGAEVVLSGAVERADSGGKKAKGKGKAKASEAEAGGAGAEGAAEGGGLTDLQVSHMLEAWTAAPFAGPSRGRAKDLGWEGGRWERAERSEGAEGGEGEEEGEGEPRWRERERWGGWVDAAGEEEAMEVGDGRAVEEVPADALHSYLPTTLPTLHQPQERYTVTVPLPGSSSTPAAAAADPPAAPTSTSGAPSGSAPGTGAPAGPTSADFLPLPLPPPPPHGMSATGFGADELPVPPAQFSPSAAGEAGPSCAAQQPEQQQPHVQAEDGDGDGSITLLLGGGTVRRIAAEGAGAGGGEGGERRVRIPRWGSLRLDSYLPSKPGHLFNAGGPVNALAWAPRPRVRASASRVGGKNGRKEYLALSTLSSLETPLRHVPPSPSTASAAELARLSRSGAFAGQVKAPTPGEGTNGTGADGAEGRRRGMVQIWGLEAVGGDVDGSSSAGKKEGEQEGEDAPMTGSDAPQQPQQKPGMRLEMALCVEEGEAWELGWCPFGGRPSASTSTSAAEDAMDVDGRDQEERVAEGRIGIVGGAFADGSLTFFEVRGVEGVRRELGKEGQGDGPVFVKSSPLLKLRLPSASLFSFAWSASGTRVAGGGSNGWIGVWDVGEALRRGLRGEGKDDPPLRPTHYFPAHSSVIRSLCFVTTPPPSLSTVADAAVHNLEGEETGIVSTGYDGSTVLSDLRSPSGGAAVLNHERTPGYCVAFAPHSGCAMIPDQDDRVKALYLRPSEIGSYKRIAPHRGAILSIATSAHHPFVLSTSVDGSCLLTSGIRAMRKRRVKGHFTQKLFRVEANRKTGEVRVWDNLDVEYRPALDPTNPISQAAKKKKSSKNAAAAHDPYHLTEQDLHTPAWPLEQGVLKAAWHPNLERCALAATGWACGVGRVDWCESEE